MMDDVESLYEPVSNHGEHGVHGGKDLLSGDIKFYKTPCSQCPRGFIHKVLKLPATPECR
jgi:hypothetical protein